MSLKNCNIYCKSWFFIVLGILAHTLKLIQQPSPVWHLPSPQTRGGGTGIPNKSSNTLCYVQMSFSPVSSKTERNHFTKDITRLVIPKCLFCKRRLSSFGPLCWNSSSQTSQHVGWEFK